MTSLFAMIQRPLIVSVAAIVVSASMLATPSRAADKLLDEAVGFADALAYLSAKVPGFVIAAVRNGDLLRRLR